MRKCALRARGGPGQSGGVTKSPSSHGPNMSSANCQHSTDSRPCSKKQCVFSGLQQQPAQHSMPRPSGLSTAEHDMNHPVGPRHPGRNERLAQRYVRRPHSPHQEAASAVAWCFVDGRGGHPVEVTVDPGRCLNDWWEAGTPLSARTERHVV